MEIFLQADTWLALLTLCFLEVVLGIDNIIFISIASNKLPEEQRKKARNTGLAFAMGVRIVLLLGISWIIGLKSELFSIWDHGFSGRDLILIFGGLFLIAKSTMEINHEMEGIDEEEKDGDSKTGVRAYPSLTSTIFQIILLDIIFSFDSILTAVGIVDQVIIMVIAVIISIGIMMFFSGAISRFIQDHPSMEVLALGFLILIGFTLLLEGFGEDIPKGYIYFSVGFSLLIEFTNIRVRKKRKQKVVKLNKNYSDEELNQAIKP
ncbi:MAG: TerC family protein [Cyclobacteriaceae bacterium]